MLWVVIIDGDGEFLLDENFFVVDVVVVVVVVGVLFCVGDLLFFGVEMVMVVDYVGWLMLWWWMCGDFDEILVVVEWWLVLDVMFCVLKCGWDVDVVGDDEYDDVVVLFEFVKCRGEVDVVCDEEDCWWRWVVECE